MSVLLKKATLTDYRQELKADLLIDGGKIAEIGEISSDRPGIERVIDADGLTVMPSFVDLHAHFRDPGLTHKEDIETGCMAAVHGGYTFVNLMPNTSPVCSDMDTVKYVLDKAEKSGLCDTHQTVSITSGFDHKTTDHIKELDSSIKWITDDGFGVDDTKTMLNAMNIAKEKGFGVMLHEEDSALTKINMYLAEELQTFRDIELAILTGCKTHFCHVSTINAAKYIIAGKKRCNHLSFEVSPHHLALNDTNGGKVAPPLRGEEHRKFLVECIKAGEVDAIATDHAPHTAEDKANGMNGFTGLDLSFATCYTALVKAGHITLSALSRLMSFNPAKLMGIDGGYIEQGAAANLVIVDTNAKFTASESDIHSKSKNSPVLGQEFFGKVIMTIKGGKIVYEKAD